MGIGQQMQRVAVIDIGKTNAKLALVDLAARAEIAVRTCPNQVRPGPPWPHFDTEAIWAFLRRGLAELAASHGFGAISVTTHGAAAALLDQRGALAAPVLDYEDPGPDDLRPEYEALRPDFAQTGAPALPLGLNLGAQLFWMLRQDTGLAARLAHVVTWPQYWGHLLTGELACDLCSLGCHTDLWNPVAATWSDLPARLGLAGKMAPPRRPDEILGHLRPELQAELGLPALPVLVGIHDSNASLMPHLMAGRPPFAVVSTGTWVIAMALGGRAQPLNPARDCLINVSALGGPVPSARFMGGRERERLMAAAGPPGQAPAGAGLADEAAVIARQVMVLPAVVQGSGPYPARQSGWTEAPRTPAEREVAVGHYLGLMTARCLDLIGAEGPVLVEGPFAANPWYCRMLATATGRVVRPSAARTGTAVGAALLLDLASGMAAPLTEGAAPEDEIGPVPALVPLAHAWLARVGP